MTELANLEEPKRTLYFLKRFIDGKALITDIDGLTPRQVRDLSDKIGDLLIEYKKESYNLFQELQQRMEEEVIKFLFLFHPVEEEELDNWKKKKKTKLAKPTSKFPGKRHKKKKKKKRR